MKIKCFCSQCLKDSDETAQDAVVRTVLLNEEGVYEFTCKNGHHNILALQNDKYDMAFHEALLELRYCVAKHAIIEFSTALDTFFEFAVKMICSLQGIEQEVYRKSWKDVKSQSERQLGAYLFVYLLSFGVKAPCLSDDNRKTRNDCVHKGRIPELHEAESFGKNVYDIILDGIHKVKELEISQMSRKGKFDTYIDHELKRKTSLASSDPGIHGTISLPTALAYSNADYEDYKTILDNPVREIW